MNHNKSHITFFNSTTFPDLRMFVSDKLFISLRPLKPIKRLPFHLWVDNAYHGITLWEYYENEKNIQRKWKKRKI